MAVTQSVPTKVTNNQMYFCEKCRKTMKGSEFYTSNNLEKYPNEGKMPICKKCLTMHVDNYDPNTYLWILQELDIPYVPEEWNQLMLKYGKDKSAMTGLTIIGRYVSKMHLKQWKDYRWKDNQYLQEIQNMNIENVMKRQGYDAQAINNVLTKGTIDIPLEAMRPDLNEDDNAEDNDADNVGNVGQLTAGYFENNPAPIKTAEELGLTEEDVSYLMIKWGKAYRPEEWVQLEKLYDDMMNSYDIQTAGHIDTLKLICKTSLKCNSLIDLGDIEGYQKMSKVYDSLMKSGRFTAAQNKAETGEYIDCVSELVAICEE